MTHQPRDHGTGHQPRYHGTTHQPRYPGTSGDSDQAGRQPLAPRQRRSRVLLITIVAIVIALFVAIVVMHSAGISPGFHGPGGH